MGRPMAKGPSYYPSKGGYYAWDPARKKRALLASGPPDCPEVARLAWEKFTELRGKAPLGRGGDGNTLAAVFDLYLAHARADLKPKTYKMRRFFLTSFLEFPGIKPLTVSRLRQADVTAWVASWAAVRKHKTHGTNLSWGQSTQGIAILSVKSAMGWARKAGHTQVNPLAGMRAPRGRSRGKAALISREEHEALLAYCHKETKPFGAYLKALWDTGARPGEMRNVTAAELKEIQGAWVLDLSSFKTERHDDAQRIIVLTPALASELRELAARRPKGALLRGKRGNAWTEKAVMMNFQRFRKKLNLSPGITAYSYRHRFATDWLVAQKSVATLAQLLGNTVATIERHYKHLLSDLPALARQVKDFRG